MTHSGIFDDMDKDTLLKDIDAFHKKYKFEKNDKVGIPENNELVNFRTSFLMEELAEYTQAITKKDAAGALDALVDIVYIALPNNLHFEWIAKGIKNNKNILVEKPAFIKLEQADIIKNEIHKKELFFAEGYMYRYNPQIIKIIQILKNQELGKIPSEQYF